MPHGVDTWGEPALEAEACKAEPALVPVFRDLRSERLPGVRLSRSDDPAVAVWLVDATGAASGVPRLSQLESASETSQEAVVRVANLVQDAVVEALASVGRSAVWPECPRHPNHPLSAGLLDERPVWRCPVMVEVVAPIGGLHAPPSRGERLR